jgi:hypothetical protein
MRQVRSGWALEVPEPTGALACKLLQQAQFSFPANGGLSVHWLTFAEGTGVGATAILTSIAIAWRQRIFQLRDRAADRGRYMEHLRELEEHESRITRRERWEPECDEIRQCLDCGEKLAYHILNNGPCTSSELEKLGIDTFIMKCSILSERGIRNLQNPLIEITNLATEIQKHAELVSDTVTTDSCERAPGPLVNRSLLRSAIFQDRSANRLAEEIKAARRVMRSEWGD